MLLSQGVFPLGGVKQGRGGEMKTRYIRAKYVNISKTIGDTSKVTINDQEVAYSLRFAALCGSHPLPLVTPY